MSSSRLPPSCTLALALIGLLGCTRHQAQPAPTDAPPNIVFLLVDALRADRLGCYGSKNNLTPTLDQIAAEGALFEQAICQAPWTHPSMASIFTSLYPTVHGLGVRYVPTDRENASKTAILSNSWTTLPEALKQAGYQTAGFVANPWMFRANGFAQGFDHYDDQDATNETNGALINQRVRQWLDGRTSKKPLFLFIHYMDVHGPYWAPEKILDPLLTRIERLDNRHQLAPEERNLGYLTYATKKYKDQARHRALALTREYWIARYDSGVRYMDDHVARLRDDLRQTGFWKNALFVLTADHGEELLERGQWNHGTSLFQEQLHVPLLMHWTDRIRPKTRVSDRVQLLDIMPTFLELADAQPPTAIQGASLLPLLEGRHWNRPAYAQANRAGNMHALYMGNLKLIDHGNNRTRTIYDLSSDPGELGPAAIDQVEQGSRLAQALQRVRAANDTLAAGHQIETIEPDEKTKKRLKALGYTK